MNMAAIARHYDTLTPWERLPLLLAAQARHDAVEYHRLARSAPKNRFAVPDYWGLLEGFTSLSQQYVLEQLDNAAFCWRLWALAVPGSLGGDRECPHRESDIGAILQFEAHCIVVRADGWRQLCADLHVDADMILRQLPGHETVGEMEALARRLAFTAEEAVGYLRELLERVELVPGREPAVRREYRLDSAADVARSMRAALEERLASWA